MAKFPYACTHWHVNVPVREVDASKALSREEALAVVRHAVSAYHRVTQDPVYLLCLADLDRGWESTKTDRYSFVAFPCSCPQPGVERTLSP